MSRTQELRSVSADLPELVRRYVDRNVPVDKQNRAAVRFTQVGEMQLKPGHWLSFHAAQEMGVDHVELSWRARFRAAPLVSLRVRDWYRAGSGGLDVRLWGVFPIANFSGDDFARGEAMRYLAELPWAPQAIAINRALAWRELDESTVEVSTLVGRERVAVSLFFDGDGDIVAASAEARPRAVGKQVVDTPWGAVVGEYREFDGVRLPTTAEVSWFLPEGKFSYFRGTVIDWSVVSMERQDQQQDAER